MKSENQELPQEDLSKQEESSKQNVPNDLDNLDDLDDMDDRDDLDGLEDLFGIEDQAEAIPGSEEDLKKKAAAQVIKWHTEAIYAGFIREIKKYPNGKKFEFKREHPLTIKPLKPDAIIISKDGAKLDYNICKAFRSHNIVEIKSQSESFTERSFKKLIAEAFLYSSIESIDLEDLTATAVLTRRPVKLLRYLIKRPSYFTLKNTHQGIVQLEICGLLIQLVMCKRLSYEENMWLRAYAEDEPDKKVCQDIILEGKNDCDEISAYMHLFIQKEFVLKFFKEELDMSPEEKDKFLTIIGYIPKELYEEALNELNKKDDELIALRKIIENAGLSYAK
ncbi:MAG: hypothetical protein LBC41_00925 [Clostridiales bacterium]|jgi:hypothetical protein|nr:hypothetical protein [Clostridiales bacterium]MDR2749197.1 hypothetical protein [Clostridiales bacterium]